MLCRKDEPACTNRHLTERHIKFKMGIDEILHIEAFGI